MKHDVIGESEYRARQMPRDEEAASSVPIPDTGSSEVYDERMRCAEIFRDAAEKLACQHASQGLIAVAEIGRRADAAQKAFIDLALKAYMESRK